MHHVKCISQMHQTHQSNTRNHMHETKHQSKHKSTASIQNIQCITLSQMHSRRQKWRSDACCQNALSRSRIHGIALNRQWDPASTFFWSIKYITQQSTTHKSIPEMHHSLNALAQCITQLNASLKFVVMPVKCISQMQTMLQSNEDNCIISQIHLVICIDEASVKSISQQHQSKHSNASVKCIRQMHQSQSN